MASLLRRIARRLKRSAGRSPDPGRPEGGPQDHARYLKKFWENRSRESHLNYVSYVQAGASWDPLEFHLTGIRFVEQMMLRLMDFGAVEPSRGAVIEIGCGIGRFVKPLACRFKQVCGVDISEEMLKGARQYCACLPNVTFLPTDGLTLNVPAASFDYCVSAGVFQHITHINIIVGYIKEALRVLKPGGVFLFQFEGHRTATVGAHDDGARITAAALDEGLLGEPYTICEVSVDPRDPLSNVVIVIKKTAGTERNDPQSFTKFGASERPWLSGVYADIKTKSDMHERLKGQPKRLTFFD